MKRRFARGALVFCACWLAYALIFWKAALGREAFFEADIHPYYDPVWRFAASCLKQGFFPLWNPYLEFGMPFFANPQTCVLYPPAWLFLAPDFTRIFSQYVLLHLAAGSFFTYFWLRGKMAFNESAWLGAIAFGLSGYRLSTIRLTPTLCSVSYFPLILWLFERALREKHFRWKAMTAAAFLMQYLAGSPDTVCATLLACFLLALKEKGLKIWLAVLVLFAGLSSFHWPLFAEYLMASTRAGGPAPGAVSWNLTPKDWPAVGLPGGRIGFPWIQNLYAGFSVLLLAAWALWKKRGKEFAALGALGLFLASGPWMPLSRFPSRHFFLVQFALAALAAFGADSLAAGKYSRLKIFGLAALVLAELAWANGGVPTVDASQFGNRAQNVKKVLEDTALFRVMTSPGLILRAYEDSNLPPQQELAERREQFFPNTVLPERLHSFWAYESLYLRGTHAWVLEAASKGPEEAKAYLDLANVRYLVSFREELPGLEKLGQGASGSLWRNSGALPRAFLLFEEQVAESKVGIRILSPKPAGSVEITDYALQRVKMEAEAARPSWLIFSDAYYPGWKLRVDGQERAILKAEGAFRAVHLSAGKHRLHWFYDPFLFKLGLFTAFLCLGITLFFCAREALYIIK